MVHPSLADQLGTSDYRLVPLRSWSARARNALRPWPIRLPRRTTAWRVETDDGRRFKLLRGQGPARAAVARLDARLRALAGFDRAPRLLWRSETCLLLEYIEGRPLSLGDPDFARQLGDGLAHLFRIGGGRMERAAVREVYAGYARRLVEHRLLAAGCVARLEAYVNEALPEQVPTGMVYADLKPANFLVDQQDRVRFIDLGSFREARILGLFLMGSGFLERLDRDAFREGYRAAGGDPFPLEFEETLQTLANVRQAVFEHRAGVGSGALRGAWRGSRRARFEALLERLRKRLEPERVA